METTTLKYSPAIRKLREKRVTVQPIRRKGQWVPENHDSAFMNEGATIGIVVPVLKGDILADPLILKEDGKTVIEFTEDDRKQFAFELGLESEKDLNPFAKKSFWRGNTIVLDRNGLVLDLNNIQEFMQYLILRSDSARIAPTWADRFMSGEYKFALKEEGEELGEKISDLEEKKKAYKLLEKIDHSSTKMKDFLHVYYLQKKEAKRPPRTASNDFLKGELAKIIDDDIEMFLEILSDKEYDVKLLIQKSVNCGALLRDRHLYTVPGADKPIGVLDELIEHIEDPRNQEFKMKLITQVDNVTE